jgi:hypothetical protein
MNLNEHIGANRSLVLGPPETIQTSYGLGIIPLLSQADVPIVPPLILVDEVIASGNFSIVEIDGGLVPTLRCWNGVQNPVLIPDGTVLRGGKQDRLVVSTIVVEPGNTVELPVNCAEAGRFHQRGRSDFEPAKMLYRAKSRASSKFAVSRTLAASNSYSGDQSGTWDAIGATLKGLGINSASDSYCVGAERVEHTITRLMEGLWPIENQVGGVFLAHNRILGAEMFVGSTLFKSAFPNVVGSFAFDVLSGPELKDVNMDAAMAWWQAILTSQSTQYASPGAGDDIRVSTNSVVASGLFWKGCMVHFSAFPNDASASPRIHQVNRRLSASERRRRMR